MQKKQATGLDTRMMMPVYAAIFSLISIWFLPWLSMPALKYSKLSPTYTVFKMKQFLENVQICITSGGRLKMEPLTGSQTEMLGTVFTVLTVLAIALMVLMVLCIVTVFRKKDRSVGFIKVTFSVNFLYSLLQCGLVIAGNLFLNGAMGRPNSFQNLSVYSYLQLTSWVYAQLIISAVLFFVCPRLMDVTREAGPQKYVERTMKSDRRMGKRTRASLIMILIAIPLVIFFGIYFLNDRSNVFIGLCIVCLAMVPFAMVFEDRQPQARELLLIAVISAIAVVGRTAFFMLPQFKPVTAIVIIAGIGLGAESGFLTGAISGFVSNFFFGQGPWTPWQMFAYGIIGFISGLLFSRRCTNKIRTKNGERLYMLVLCTYGALATFFIYGFIMDFSASITMVKDFSWELLLAKLASGVVFNLIHAVSTVVFLLLLARPIQRKLDRIKKKYGILEV